MASERRAKLAIFAFAVTGLLALVLMRDRPASYLAKADGESEASLFPSAVQRSEEVRAQDSDSANDLDVAAKFARAKVDAILNSPSSNVSKQRSPSEQALDRLVQIRKCEKLAGTLNQKSLSGPEASRCPVNHPEALDHAGGYSQVLVDQTVMELAFLRELALATRRRGLNDPFDVSQIAKVYVNHADDNVREQALALAGILPDSQGLLAMEIAAKALSQTVSGPLSTQALEILARHRKLEPEVADRAVVRALKQGGWDVRDAVASQSLPFITAGNRTDFAKVMDSEPLRSKLRLHLRLNLEEFDRSARL